MIGIAIAIDKYCDNRRSTLAPKSIDIQPKKDPWINRWWRPLAAVVYLLICVCDFIVFPWYFGLKGPTVGQIALAVKDLDPSVGSVLAAPRSQWQPLTLMGGGMFHVAFGAILGVAAWTRGAEKVEEIRRNAYRDYDYNAYDYEHEYGRGDHRGWRDRRGDGRRWGRSKDDCVTTDEYRTPPITDEVDNPDLS